MSATPHDGTGTVLRLGATIFTVTNIVITNTDPNAGQEKIDVSHIGLTATSPVKTIDRPLQGSASETGRQVVFDYLGNVLIADASTGTCSITVNNVALINGIAFTVNSSTLTLATNDAIRGQATVRLARP